MADNTGPLPDPFVVDPDADQPTRTDISAPFAHSTSSDSEAAAFFDQQAPLEEQHDHLENEPAEEGLVGEEESAAEAPTLNASQVVEHVQTSGPEVSSSAAADIRPPPLEHHHHPDETERTTLVDLSSDLGPRPSTENVNSQSGSNAGDLHALEGGYQHDEESLSADRATVPAPVEGDVFIPEILFIPLSHTDPLNTLLVRHIPPHQRPPRDPSALSSYTHESVSSLISAQSWRAVATLARDEILARTGRGEREVKEILHLWELRLHALVRLRFTNHFARELSALWRMMESVSVPAFWGEPIDHLAGSTRDRRSLLLSPLVPFSLHVLRARAPYVVRGDGRRSVEALCVLIRNCKIEAKQARLRCKTAAVEEGEETCGKAADLAAKEAEMWRDRGLRTGLIAASLLVDMKDYPSALALLEPLLSSAASDSTSSSARLFSTLARLHLEAGSLTSAAELFERARQRALSALSGLDVRQDEDIDAESVPTAKEPGGQVSATERGEEEYGLPLSLQLMLKRDRGLLSAARGDWAGAEVELRSALELSPGDGALINDLAVVAFFQGRLQEPIDLLEGLLRDSPSQMTNCEPSLFNLTTFYELRGDNSLAYKRKVLVEVAKFGGGGLGSIGCLKL